MGQILSVDYNTYTTNNYFLGHMANVLNYDLEYYEPADLPVTKTVTRYDTSMNCFSWATMQGYTCSELTLYMSGTNNIYTQNFEDITAPILFFLSLL